MCATPLQVSPPLPDLPEELVLSILLRLPVKSLLKFKCVSKSWLELISSCRFVKEHIKISTKNNIYNHDRLICGSSRSLPTDLYTHSIQSVVEKSDFTGHHIIYPSPNLYLPGHRVWFDYPSVDILQLVGSCNGLICVSLTSKHMENLIIWNPATRKSKTLPYSGTDRGSHGAPSFGFGYDVMHDDYKVFEILTFFHETCMKVYSLRANSWMTMSNRSGVRVFGGPGWYLNGAIHWEGVTFTRPIVSYDLAEDTFKVFSRPPFEDTGRVKIMVNVLQGCLAVSFEHKTYMDVWLMKEYGVTESWKKLVRITFFCDIWDRRILTPVPLFLLVDERILMNYGRNLRIYDPRYPQNHSFSGDAIGYCHAVTYFESLVSLDLDDGTDPENVG